MADFGKAYCNLHPHEVITNFCCKCKDKFTKSNVWWDSAQTASVLTPNHMWRKALLQIMRISKQPVRKCTSASKIKCRNSTRIKSES